MIQAGRDGVCLFGYMCSAADKNDIVALSKTVLGQRAGFNPHDPEDWAKFEKCLAILEAPDPESNLPDHNGRRIIPLKDIPEIKGNRGWFIVNRKYYTMLQAKEDQREQARIRKQRQRLRERLETEGKPTEEIEKEVLLWEQSLTNVSHPGHAMSQQSRHIDIDVDLHKRLEAKICENCQKPFVALEKYFTKCPSCFKSQKGNHLAQPPTQSKYKTCPYCGYTANYVIVNHKLKGCNSCKPEEID